MGPEFAFPTGNAGPLGSTTFEFGTEWWGGFHSAYPELLGRGRHWRFQKHVGHATATYPHSGPFVEAEFHVSRKDLAPDSLTVK